MKYEAVVLEYLPVNHHPPHYPICKEYLDFLLEVIDELEIYFMYVHSEEMVYAKLCVKTKIYTPNCSFNGWLSSIKSHAAAAKQIYFPKGYREWCVDAKTIAEYSIYHACEGRQYYRSMRVHKECFHALV